MKKRSAVIVVLILALVSCMTAEVKIKPISEMTPKEKSVFMMNLYNKQYADYKKVAAMPDITEAQKEILRYKKEVFTTVYPLINTYVVMVDAGAQPGPELENDILDLLNELTQAVTE